MRCWIDLLENKVEIQSDMALRAWFGNSVVENDDGTPKVVYHGGGQWRVAPGTTWFTDEPYIADGYADQGYADPEVKPCYLRILRPLDLRNEDVVNDIFPDDEWIAKVGVAAAIKYSRDYVQSAILHAHAYDYDGVIHYDSDVKNRGHHTSYVIFNPTQVKAARFIGWEHESIYGDHKKFDDGNKGTYDGKHPDIRETKNPK